MKKIKRSFLIELEVSPYESISSLNYAIKRHVGQFTNGGEVTSEHVTKKRLQAKISEMDQEDQIQASIVQEKIKNTLKDRVIPSDAEISKIESVGRLTEIPVQFASGQEAYRDRLLVTAKTDVYDEFVEDFLPEKRVYTFWGEKAVEAANKLEKDGYLYVRDVAERKTKTPDGQIDMIFRSVNNFKSIAKDRYEKLKEAILDREQRRSF